jgi:hypothetical protein
LGGVFFRLQVAMTVPVFRPLLSRISGTLSLCAILVVLALFSDPASAAPRALFKTAAFGAPDTLEVFVLYVQFEEEVPDETGTTGTGSFGSDKDISYDLDPNGESIRRSADYLTKRFQFAQDYFDKVSGGRVVIKPRLFPEPRQNGLVPVESYRLKRMKSYNPALEYWSFRFPKKTMEIVF